MVDRRLLVVTVLGELVDQPVDRLEDRIERVEVARQDHPARERAGAFLVERVEGQIDHFARITIAGARAHHRVADLVRHRFGDPRGERLLQPGGRAEMVQEIGMRPPDPRGDGLERDCLRPRFEQDRARRFERDVARFDRAQAPANY